MNTIFQKIQLTVEYFLWVACLFVDLGLRIGVYVLMLVEGLARTNLIVKKHVFHW